jgi:hypothetical protein
LLYVAYASAIGAWIGREDFIMILLYNRGLTMPKK